MGSRLGARGTANDAQEGVTIVHGELDEIAEALTELAEVDTVEAKVAGFDGAWSRVIWIYAVCADATDPA